MFCSTIFDLTTAVAKVYRKQNWKGLQNGCNDGHKSVQLKRLNLKPEKFLASGFASGLCTACPQVPAGFPVDVLWPF